MKLAVRLALLAIALAIIAVTVVASADAHLVAKRKDNTREAIHASQLENLKHVRYVCRHGAASTRRWHCAWVKILRQEARETAPRPLEGRPLAHALARARGWPTWALDEIIGQESGYNPCRHYPQTTNCAYQGINACGIPQRVPCPAHWRGRLWETRMEQVYWMIDYIQGRYNGIWGALAHKRSTGWY